MKHLLVTGGCGFIGSNFIRHLLSAPDFDGEIINVDKLTYAGNPENLVDVENTYADRYHFVEGDICDTRLLAEVFARYEIDSICHLAAESHVDRSIAGPDAFIQTNIIGTFRLLEQFRENSERIKRFHHVSTDEVFGSLGTEGFFRESTPYDPSSPYSASKASADHLVRAYGRTYHLPVTISNCSNNYGPYQFPEKLIPLMILEALAGNPLPVYGDGLHIRDWLYVTDHCRALWLIMKKGQIGQTYNVGGRSEVCNIDVVKSICRLLDSERPLPDGRSHKKLIAHVTDRPGHDRRYAIDCSRLEAELGWRPEETFDTGLRKTLLWYLENPEWVKRLQTRGDGITPEKRGVR